MENKAEGRKSSMKKEKNNRKRMSGEKKLLIGEGERKVIDGEERKKLPTWERKGVKRKEGENRKGRNEK